MGALFGVKIDLSQESDASILTEKCQELLTLGFGCKPKAVVVRLGERGCYCAHFVRHVFFPAFHGPSSGSEAEHTPYEDAQSGSEKPGSGRGNVIDPTGCGNAFLGGFCIGLLDERHPGGLTEFEVGCIYGSVAASFAIEQVGMPKLTRERPETAELWGKESWNGESVRDRLSEYERGLRLAALSEEQLQEASL